MTLALDLSLHPNPLVALLMSNPGAQLTVHELRAGLGDHVAAAYNLTRMVGRGNLTATPGEDGLLRYGLGRAPARKHHLHATHEGRTLPTDATLHPCPLIALILANPGAAITLPDVRTTLPRLPPPVPAAQLVRRQGCPEERAAARRVAWVYPPAPPGPHPPEPHPGGTRGTGTGTAPRTESPVPRPAACRQPPPREAREGTETRQ